jgi:hypothetical protein
MTVDPIDPRRQKGGVKPTQAVVLNPEGPLRDGVQARKEAQERDGPGWRNVAAQEGARPRAQRAGVQELQAATPRRVASSTTKNTSPRVNA